MTAAPCLWPSPCPVSVCPRVRLRDTRSASLPVESTKEKSPSPGRDPGSGWGGSRRGVPKAADAVLSLCAHPRCAGLLVHRSGCGREILGRASADPGAFGFAGRSGHRGCSRHRSPAAEHGPPARTGLGGRGSTSSAWREVGAAGRSNPGLVGGARGGGGAAL